MRWVHSIALASICASLAVAAPATGSTTLPTDLTGQTEAAQRDAASAATTASTAAMHLADAKSSCISRLHATDDFIAAAQRRSDAEKRLDEARESDDATAKLDASSAFNKERAAVSTMESDAIAADPAVLEAAEKLAKDKGAASAAASRLSQLRAEEARRGEADAAQAAYIAKHAALFSALGKLLDIRTRAPVQNSPGKDPYLSYEFRTQNVVDALRLLDSPELPSESVDEYAQFSEAVASDVEVWEKSLSTTEAIYPSADAVRSAAKHYTGALVWLKLGTQFSKEADEQAKKNETDAAVVSSESATSVLDRATGEFKAGSDETELARRDLITRENTRPAVPDAPQGK
jgi:hypothetical protein